MRFDDEGLGSALSDDGFREWETEFDEEVSGLREENTELTSRLEVMVARYEALYDLLDEVADGLEEGAPHSAELLRRWLDHVEES